MTNGLSPQLVGIMERLVAYTPVFMHYDPNSAYNPPSFFHYNVSDGRGRYDLLARVSACGLDHTKRSNKIGHFFLISEAEKRQLAQGPSSLLRDSMLFLSEWRGEPQLFPAERRLNVQELVPAKASAWEQATGDAGWAAWLASQYLARPDKPCFVLFDPLRQTNLQLLVSESLMLLPPNKRWEVTWNTYLTELPVGQSCQWRFCVKNPELLNRIGYQVNAPVLDLTQGLGVADNSQLCQCARTGENPYPRATDKPGNIQAATVEQDDGLSLSALMRKRQEEAARAAAEVAEAARRKAEQQAQEAARISLKNNDDNPWANNSVNTPRANPFRLKGNSPQPANMGMTSNNSPWGNNGVNTSANANPYGPGFGASAYDNNFNQNGMDFMFNTIMASNSRNRTLMFVIGGVIAVLQVLTIGLLLYFGIMSKGQPLFNFGETKRGDSAPAPAPAAAPAAPKSAAPAPAPGDKSSATKSDVLKSAASASTASKSPAAAPAASKSPASEASAEPAAAKSEAPASTASKSADALKEVEKKAANASDRNIWGAKSEGDDNASPTDSGFKDVNKHSSKPVIGK